MQRKRVRRFTTVQRIFHLLLILFFTTQAATGLARLYIETGWGKRLAWVFGGYELSLQIHKVMGILMMCGFVIYAIYLFSLVNWRRFPRVLFSPDSLLPQPKDMKDFFQHVGWFLRISKAPKFERWAYWEKFDFWAVFWGIPLLGITGLLLSYSIAASRIMPGWGLNVALWVHRIEALLAMAHVFIIHFFVAHLRRHNFPMDRTMFEGTTDLEATRHERSAWVERLEQSGRLETLLAFGASLKVRALFYLFGYAAMAAGIYLLIGGLVNSASVTW
ncbi:MAG: cytochrome b/b6 domain-containing protein [Deltaproteobacteria bacterium]|nr:cytochrome b/b6 domain-containing protein [Deltaproteobacteria bacterium]